MGCVERHLTRQVKPRRVALIVFDAFVERRQIRYVQRG